MNTQEEYEQSNEGGKSGDNGVCGGETNGFDGGGRSKRRSLYELRGQGSLY